MNEGACENSAGKKARKSVPRIKKNSGPGLLDIQFGVRRKC